MSKSRRQLMLEAQNVAALAKVYQPMVPEDVIYVTPSTLCGLLTRADRPQEAIALRHLSDPVGHECRVGCKKYRVHRSPCRLCGGTGEVLERKFSGNARYRCDKCSGRGFKDVV